MIWIGEFNKVEGVDQVASTYHFASTDQVETGLRLLQGWGWGKWGRRWLVTDVSTSHNSVLGRGS